MHFRLFDRPLITDDPLARMYIDGLYDDYTPGTEYEGRVNIHGSVGNCTVEILDGNLPPGAYAYVDNVFKQVVVKWPKYTPPTETFTLLENGDFSEGDTGSWTNTGEGNPFVIEPDSDGNMSMKFKSGFGGGHFSRSPLAPVANLNRQITLKGQIAQGKSSKGKLWGGLLLCWFDKDRNILSWDESNWIMSGGGYQEAKVTAAPVNSLTKFVCAQIHFDRKGQNHPGWADNIQWDHVWSKGYTEGDQLFVTVKVTDSVNNTATHRGIIDEVYLWLTSQPYGYGYSEGIQGIGQYGTAQGIGENFDRMQAAPVFVSAKSEVKVKYATYQFAETVPQMTPVFVKAESEVVVKYSTYQFAEVVPQMTPSFVSASSRIANINQAFTDRFQWFGSFVSMEVTRK